MKLSIISTGDELLKGAISDTNGAWLASRIHDRGLKVDRITVAPDRLEDLSSLLTRAFEDNDIILVGGGLGPTDDDLTARAAAAALGTNLVRNDEAAVQVRTAFERIGRPMNEINLKQADLPTGCNVLSNPNGTAPGFSLSTARARAFFLPGVPFEMKAMFDLHVAGELPAPDRQRQVVSFRCFGMGESNIQAALKPVLARHPSVEIAFRASFREIGLTASAPSADPLRDAAKEIREVLGATIFAEGDSSLPQVLGKKISSMGLTLSTAESCTGGLIAHELTQVPGASSYLTGGIVAYDNEVKINSLNVDRDLIVARGAVSEEVAMAMAEGARQALGTDLSIATSGVAGPDGGTDDKPVGLVHLAVHDGQKLSHRRCMFKGYGRTRVKVASAWTAMWMLYRTLSEKK